MLLKACSSSTGLNDFSGLKDSSVSSDSLPLKFLYNPMILSLVALNVLLALSLIGSEIWFTNQLYYSLRLSLLVADFYSFPVIQIYPFLAKLAAVDSLLLVALEILAALAYLV